jgi:hypothetical protein
MVDSLWENGAENIGDAISDGWTAVTDTGEALKDGVTGGAKAAAGGIKDVWDSIF